MKKSRKIVPLVGLLLTGFIAVGMSDSAQTSVAIQGIGTITPYAANIEFAAVPIGNYARSVSGTIVGNQGYFTVEDLNATKTRVLQMELSELKTSGSEITEASISINQTAWSAGVTPLNNSPPNSEIEAIGQSNQPFGDGAQVNVMQRKTASNKKMGMYGVRPTFSMVVPAYQEIGDYEGTITLTISTNTSVN